MRVCSECGRENIAHLPRYVKGYIPCACDYEDIIAGLKNQLLEANRKSNREIGIALCARNQAITQRNRQIKDLLKRVKELEK